MRRQLKDKMMDAALEYAARGWPVFPCHTMRNGRCSCGKLTCGSPGKHPIGQLAPQGLKNASTDADIIQAWWTKVPDANIALAIPDDMIVIDVDIKHDEGKHGDDTLADLEQQYGKLPKTMVSLTGGGGQQYFFSTQSALPGPVGVFPSIDARGKGNYVILPPSMHKSGRRYEWDALDGPDTPLASVPGWFKDALLAPKGMKLHTLGKVEGKILEPTRNETLFKLASSLRAKGLAEDAILAALLVTNNTRCVPALEDEEVQTIVHSAGKYEAGALPTAAAQDFAEPVDWQPPILFTEDQLPPFPVEALPPTLRDFVEAVAESLQVPVDLPAVVCLGVSSMCLQRKFKIEGKPDWQEPLNLYTTAILPPGERKSAVTSLATAPILRYERAQNDFLRPAIEASEIRRAVLAKKIQAMKDAAAKPNRKRGEGKALDFDAEINDEDGIAAIVDKQGELTSLEADAPRELRLWTDDATPEALCSLLADNGGRMSIISAEGGIFDALNGRYSNGVNIDVLLKAHAGDAVRVDRKGRPSEYIPNPALTVFLAIQPHILNGLMSNDDFRGRGLTARFLYSIPTSKVGGRIYDTKTISEANMAAYEALIRSLLAIPLPMLEGILRLSPEAQELSRCFYNELEPRLKDDLESLADWAGKLHGAIMRIAGVMHCVEHGAESDKHLVAAGTFADAVTIGNYFLEHAKAAYQLMGVDQTTADAQYILRQLEKRRPAEITRTELNKLCHGRFPKAEKMNPGIATLIECGYLREKSAPVGYNNRTQTAYQVNPKAHENAGDNQPSIPI